MLIQRGGSCRRTAPPVLGAKSTGHGGGACAAGGAPRPAPPARGWLGPYALQAAIAACHARAPTAGDTDWVRIAALYDALAQVAPSPVVELNRAVAVAMAFGPAAGLDLVDALTEDPALRSTYLLPAVRGDLLARLGRVADARVAFERAASLARNHRERDLLLARANDDVRDADRASSTTTGSGPTVPEA